MEKRKYLRPAVKDTEYMEVTLLSDSPGAGGNEGNQPGGDWGS